MLDLAVKNAKVVTEDGMFFGGIGVEGGKITMMGTNAQLPAARSVIDADGQYLLPGCIDSHVHIRYPGISHREDFASGSLAAAGSGTTVLIEMPLSSPPTYSVDELMVRVSAAESQSIIDFGFLGAAGNKLQNIMPLAKAGVLGFKTFLQTPPAGREHEFIGLTMENEYQLYKGFAEVAKTGLPLGAHTESIGLVTGIISEFKAEGKISAEYHAKSRPSIAEVEMVEKLIRYAREFNVPLYLTHLTTSESIRIANQARRMGQRLIIETCPHYLYFTEEDIARYGTYAVCNPPMRSKMESEALWTHLNNGDIDIISSDHAPYTAEEKKKGLDNIFMSPPGMPGLEMRVPLIMKAVKEKRLTLQTAVKLLSTNAAKSFGLYPKKGSIKIGSDADLVLMDLDTPYKMDHNQMRSKCKESGVIYDGIELYGKVLKTVVRGTVVYDQEGQAADAGYGEWLRPGKAEE